MKSTVYRRTILSCWISTPLTGQAHWKTDLSAAAIDSFFNFVNSGLSKLFIRVTNSLTLTESSSEMKGLNLSWRDRKEKDLTGDVRVMVSKGLTRNCGLKSFYHIGRWYLVMVVAHQDLVRFSSSIGLFCTLIFRQL